MSASKIVHINTPLKSGVIQNEITGKVEDLFASDRAHSRFFTINIDKLNGSNILTKGNISTLPVKNISYAVTGVDNMTLNIGVFKDVPIPTGKKLPKITMSFTDDAYDKIESGIRSWYDLIIPSRSGVARYLNEMVGSLSYKSYLYNGKVNFTYTAAVILADDLIINRSYENNSLKEIEISLIVLSDSILADVN